MPPGTVDCYHEVTQMYMRKHYGPSYPPARAHYEQHNREPSDVHPGSYVSSRRSGFAGDERRQSHSRQSLGQWPPGVFVVRTDSQTPASAQRPGPRRPIYLGSSRTHPSLIQENSRHRPGRGATSRCANFRRKFDDVLQRVRDAFRKTPRSAAVQQV
jgi:hypothetical protein